MLDFIVNSFKSNPFTAFSLGFSIGALIFSYISWKKTRTATLYSDIDARYLELLKLGINYPKFVNPDLTKDYKNKFKDNELLQYERYAFAAWNIVETIVDRRKGDLKKTWDPVIGEENKLHRKWLNNPENQIKFKRDFREFMVKNNKVFPCPDCNGSSKCSSCAEL